RYRHRRREPGRPRRLRLRCRSWRSAASEWPRFRRRGYPLGNSLHGKLQALQLAADGRIEQARTDLHDETAENVGIDARVDGNLCAAQDGAQRIGELLQL